MTQLKSWQRMTREEIRADADARIRATAVNIYLTSRARRAEMKRIANRRDVMISLKDEEDAGV